MSTTPDGYIETQPIPLRLSRWRVPLAVLAGLIVGLAASSLFALAVFASGALGIATIGGAVAAALVAGAVFSVLLAVARDQRVEWVDSLGLGLIMVVVGTLALVVPLSIESLARGDPEPVLQFRVAFVLASTLMAVACTAIASLIFGVQGWRVRGVLVGVATGLTYLLATTVLDVIPGFHVGGGNMAMPKVTAISNLVAGFVGGTLAHLLLSSRR
jgi:hypothetical protein